jgi:mRNA interferase MazF
VSRRGDIVWANLSEPRGAEPGYERPVLIVQDDEFNRSRLPTVLCVALTSNTMLADHPRNVLLPPAHTGLPRESVATVTNIPTVDRRFLGGKVGSLSPELLFAVDNGLRRLLGL